LNSNARLINSEQLQQDLHTENLCILDCRFDLLRPLQGRDEWLAGHIPGARYANLDTDLATGVGPETGRHPLPTPEEFAKTLGELGIDNDSRVVVYDSGNGALAARAWWLIRWLGHDDVSLLDGGFASWTQADFTVQQGPISWNARRFQASAQPDRIFTTADIISWQGRPCGLQLVDARDAARFSGESEPIDPVAGHIPGAVNFPLSRSLDASGCWLDPDALRLKWAPVLGALPGCEWAVMCGSGVTACHLAFSGLRAGYQEPRLYAGSWSEWIRDPARAVGTGL
jgi:thiosulfate/3-mercaptopyruvate sulfurtransferase